MSITKESFGHTPDGHEATLYIIDNGTIRACVSDYGAHLVSLFAPDRYGQQADIILGFDSAEGYAEDGSNQGATIAPVANRTGDACAEIGGKTYYMPVNDGVNNLHSDRDCGGHRVMWDAAESDNAVTFRTNFADGAFGLPGNRNFAVTYTVTDDNALMIHYHAVSDQETILNPTNHSYFNLAGQGSGTILTQEMQLFCSAFTPVREGSIPTGEIRPVSGTAMDFREAKPIGRDINKEEEQLQITGGFDHNFVIDGYTGDGSMLPVAAAFDRKSGRVMETFTTLPGVQFYVGNYLNGSVGKGGSKYEKRTGFCLETQFFPDSIHHSGFPSYLFGPGHEYDSTTKYKFGTKA